MTLLERQIRKAKHRLWLNRWLRMVLWSIAAVGVAFSILVLADRLFALEWPLFRLGCGAGVLALIASAIGVAVRREGPGLAAARLDEAAGLRERLSSGLHCLPDPDPFAQAVVADAQRVSGALTVRKHLRMRIPSGPLGFSMAGVILAACMFLIPPGVLRSESSQSAEERDLALESTKVAVKRQLEDVRRVAEATPALEDLQAELARLDSRPLANIEQPAQLRHEAVKRIDSLADAVKKKQAGEEYETVKSLQRKMRALRDPTGDDLPTQKLAQALRSGDFKSAKEEIQAVKEQLATLKSDQDRELAKKLSENLDQLAKQLENLARDERLAQKLEQAGIKKEDVERLLERLNKDDLEQLKKKLEEQGLERQQVRNLLDELARQQRAGSAAQKLAQAMKVGAKCNNPGQMGDAMDGLSQAAEQLGELEMLEQELGELDSTLQSLQAAKESLDKPCPACEGSGQRDGKPCGRCNGSGRADGAPGPGGMGTRMGQGRGGLAPEEEAAAGFKVERAKVHTGKGAIVGQFRVDGEQFKGDAAAELVEIVAAAERDAADRIDRDRIPRQYHKAIKTYFANTRRQQGNKNADASGSQPESSDASPNKAEEKAPQSAAKPE
jgi:hypothetical protein